MVILTNSSTGASCSGGGKKSSISFRLPTGLSSGTFCFVFPFIQLPSFAPETGADNANFLLTAHKPDRRNFIPYSSDAKKPLLCFTVERIHGNNTFWIKKHFGCLFKINPMHPPIISFLFGIPNKRTRRNGTLYVIVWHLYGSQAILFYVYFLDVKNV